jgi:hypothetical protein
VVLIRLFLAGNFPQLSKIEKERKFLTDLLEEGKEYNRLISFYYLDEAEVVLNLAREFSKGKEEYLEEKIETPKMKKTKIKGFV